MANNWAIVIGINDYQHHPEQKLKYAVNDAQQVGDFLSQQIGFSEAHVIRCLGDTTRQGSSTYPTCSNLLRLLRRDLHPDQLGKVNHLWFYFSGHGVSRNGRDYLLTADCLEDEIERFALPLDEVIATLRLHKDADIVLVLDACRQLLGRKTFDNSIGEQTIAAAKERGITTIFSCDYGQYSYELDALQQGAFTYALVEGLSRHTLPIQLETYLRQRVPELHRQHRRDLVEQTPRIRLESLSKAFQPLLPDAVTASDLEVLVKQATADELKENFETAKKLWWQMIDVSQSSVQRQEARTAIERIDRKIARLSSKIPAIASSQNFTFLKEEIERELGFPFFDRIIQLVRQRIESLLDEQIAYYVGVIITGIEERFALKGREDFYGEKSFTFWFLSRGLAQLGLSRQQKIIGHIRKQEFEADNGTLFAIHDLITAAGGVKGDHYYQEGDIIAPSDEGWELLEQVFRSEELAAFRNSSAEQVGEVYTSKISSTESEDDLSSERFGANYYAKLRDLLKAQDWGSADWETRYRMLELIDWQEEGWLGLEDMEKLPCQDLQTIDQLWVKYSQGKFGFSVQKKIYVECGAKLNGKHPEGEIWDKFGDYVGWRKNDRWLYYNELKHNPSPPQGNLPMRWQWSYIRDILDGYLYWERRASVWCLFSRLETCKV